MLGQTGYVWFVPLWSVRTIDIVQNRVIIYIAYFKSSAYDCKWKDCGDVKTLSQFKQNFVI